MSSGYGLKILASILIIILILIAFYISRFFVGTVTLSILLAYMLLPIYKMAYAKTRSEKISSLIAVSTIFIAAILIFLVFYRSISMGIANLSESAYQAANQAAGIAGENFLDNLGIIPKSANFSNAEEIETIIQGGILPFAVSFVIPAIIQSAIDAWIFPATQTWLLNLALSLPIFIAQIIVAMFFAYYLILTGKRASEGFTGLFSGSQRDVFDYFLRELDGVLKRLFTANFDVAAYNALVGMIIFSLIGMPFAILWALLAAFLSLIRFLGPWVVFVPLSFYSFLINDFSRGFLILLFGVTLLEYVPEYLLRPHLSKGSSQVNVIIEFLSYVAPIFVLGPVGIIIGPLIYGILIAIYRTASYFGKTAKMLP